MHDTREKPPIGRYAIDARGNRIKLSPLTDAAYADMAGDPTPPRFRDLDEGGSPILFPATSDPEPEEEA
jgi:hypothetical protein